MLCTCVQSAIVSNYYFFQNFVSILPFSLVHKQKRCNKDRCDCLCVFCITFQIRHFNGNWCCCFDTFFCCCSTLHLPVRRLKCFSLRFRGEREELIEGEKKKLRNNVVKNKFGTSSDSTTINFVHSAFYYNAKECLRDLSKVFEISKISENEK